MLLNKSDTKTLNINSNVLNNSSSTVLSVFFSFFTFRRGWRLHPFLFIRLWVSKSREMLSHGTSSWHFHHELSISYSILLLLLKSFTPIFRPNWPVLLSLYIPTLPILVKYIQIPVRHVELSNSTECWLGEIRNMLESEVETKSGTMTTWGVIGSPQQQHTVSIEYWWRIYHVVTDRPSPTLWWTCLSLSRIWTISTMMWSRSVWNPWLAPSLRCVCPNMRPLEASRVDCIVWKAFQRVKCTYCTWVSDLESFRLWRDKNLMEVFGRTKCPNLNLIRLMVQLHEQVTDKVKVLLHDMFYIELLNELWHHRCKVSQPHVEKK